MYHARFKGTHYEAGLKWGRLLFNKGIKLDFSPTFELTAERSVFAEKCLDEYQRYFPEVLDEIRGIAVGNNVPENLLQSILFSLYCFELDNRCTVFAISTANAIIFGRNSDFLKSLEKLYMNCIYCLSGCNSFNANSTAYVQMEDGINEHGLAAGLTFVYPRIRKPGLNAGMLVRYILEKCSTTKESVEELYRLPIASAQTITLADKKGDIAVVECNPENIVVIEPEPGEHFVATANNFNSIQMQCWRNGDIDDWRSDERYQTAYKALKNNKGNYSVDYAKSILSGEYGFMCQYDRKGIADTVWSVVYDIKHSKVWRVEGNPSRKQFREDTRSR